MEPNAPLNNATQYLAGANIGKGTMNNESSGKTLPVMKFCKDKDTHGCKNANLQTSHLSGYHSCFSFGRRWVQISDRTKSIWLRIVTVFLSSSLKFLNRSLLLIRLNAFPFIYFTVHYSLIAPIIWHHHKLSYFQHWNKQLCSWFGPEGRGFISRWGLEDFSLT